MLRYIRMFDVFSERDLGLNQFPYKRLQRGEFEVEGVPSSLLPLKPLLKMNSLELKQLMDSAVSIKRYDYFNYCVLKVIS